jgi:hypothetical protein
VHTYNTEGHGIDKFLVDDKQTSQAIATKEEGMLILEIQHGIVYFCKCTFFRYDKIEVTDIYQSTIVSM